MTNFYPAKLTTGDEYSGNQQFKGMGITRWCLLCDGHRNLIGGSFRRLFGIPQWVCAKHTKAKPL